MSFETKIYTFLFGKLVGEDRNGNKYYTLRKADRKGNKKRWVLYKGIEEASKVSAEWFNWLHKTSDKIPEKDQKIYDWQKPSLPNLTGTNFAYKPSGHPQANGVRDKVSGDYEAWKP